MQSLPFRHSLHFSSEPSSTPTSSYPCHSSCSRLHLSLQERSDSSVLPGGCHWQELQKCDPSGPDASSRAAAKLGSENKSRLFFYEREQTLSSAIRGHFISLSRHSTCTDTRLNRLSAPVLLTSPAKSVPYCVFVILVLSVLFSSACVVGVSSLSSAKLFPCSTPHISSGSLSPLSAFSSRTTPCSSLPLRPLHFLFIPRSEEPAFISSCSPNDSSSLLIASHSSKRAAQRRRRSLHQEPAALGFVSRHDTHAAVSSFRSRVSPCMSQRSPALYGCCGQKASCGGERSAGASSAAESGKLENKVIPRVGKSTAGPRPDWFHVPAPQASSRNAEETRFQQLQKQIRGLDLHTVCEEAKCPNIGECWNGGTATLILLGDTCTRGCRFCAIKTSQKPPPPDPEEPEKVAAAVAKWDIDYLVMTSVDRDDMADGGASHFARTVQLVKKAKPSMLVECLVSDFQGAEESVRTLAQSGLDVYAHNIETVRRLTPFVRDKRAKYDQSLRVLQLAKKLNPSLFTKSSIMVGLGETEEEVVQTFKDLRAHDVDVVTLGQYLRPTQQQLGVVEYVTPETFQKYQEIAEGLGFKYVASGPLVRSSYKAGEYFMKHLIDDARKKGQVDTVHEVKLEADVGTLKGRRTRLDGLEMPSA